MNKYLALTALLLVAACDSGPKTPAEQAIDTSKTKAGAMEERAEALRAEAESLDKQADAVRAEGKVDAATLEREATAAAERKAAGQAEQERARASQRAIVRAPARNEASPAPARITDPPREPVGVPTPQ
ncbi:MAG: hypothetical protein GW859_10495 [Sphingomonadales bacterium]|nr:hypothetical protein [Sphingomonadales bacterium]